MSTPQVIYTPDQVIRIFGKLSVNSEDLSRIQRLTEDIRHVQIRLNDLNAELDKFVIKYKLEDYNQWID